MKKYIYIAALFLVTVSLSAQTNWVVDKSHSKISFEVSHLIVSSVTGYFTDYDIVFENGKDDFTDAKISFSAKVNSINTANEKRDEHLRGADFFDAEKFPVITFVGKKFEKTGKDKYKLTGDFTIRDVTKSIALDVKYNGTVKDPWGNIKSGFKITGEINRYDFGLKWNKALEAGGVVVGENVEIVCVLELNKK